MAKECLVCGKAMGAFTAKVALSDGYTCVECWTKAGFATSVNAMMSGKQYSGIDITKMIAIKEQNQLLMKKFSPTKVIDVLSFDDNTQILKIKKSKKDSDLYYYNQIVSFELLEDGNNVTKGGLGRAAVGGLLFGGVGAIVGGVTGGKKTKGICTSLQIKITFRNSPQQTEYIRFITTDTKKTSFLYKSAYENAQEILSALQLAVDAVNTTFANSAATTTSDADELLKFKKLLDAGIISEEEFDSKKRQLLGL